ncbi:MAG: hypothetical protein Q7V36_08530 [Deltaproteobacteria bacterium]|nr:hypothetical protein [Deltaproteobacteria bacterium]
MTRKTTTTIITHSIQVVLSPDGGHTIPDLQGAVVITGKFLIRRSLGLLPSRLQPFREPPHRIMGFRPRA